MNVDHNKHTCVSCHFLLSNDDLLRAVDDEIATRVQWTLIQLSQITIRQVV